MRSEPVPLVGYHRDVGIHADQPAERIEHIVKPEIDLVLDRLHDLEELFRFARSIAHCPEARLLAAAKVEAAWTLRSEDRRGLPATSFDRDDLAAAAGPWLSHKDGRSLTHYCGTWEALLAGPDDQPVPREAPLPRSEGI